MSPQTTMSRFFAPSPSKLKRNDPETEKEEIPSKKRRIDTSSVGSAGPSTVNQYRCTPSPIKENATRTKFNIKEKKSRRMRALLDSAGDCVPRRSASRGRSESLAPEAETSSMASKNMEAFSSDPEPTKNRVKKGQEAGPSGKTWTELEKQVVKLKQDNPGVLLMIEVGYKYKFFGEDARVASQTLGIVAFVDRNFLTAMIPVFTREVHLKKLLSQGYTVGIVEQTETAALKKAGENRNKIFERKLVRLHTANTYSNQMDSVDDVNENSSPPLMFLSESSCNQKTLFAFVSINPSTGDVVLSFLGSNTTHTSTRVWDEFEDTPLRIELETRLAHIQPSEVLLPRDGISYVTDSMLKVFTTRGNENPFRIQRFSNDISYTEAFDYVSDFYVKLPTATAGLAADVTNFPKTVVIILAQAIQYLKPYGVADALRSSHFYTRFTARAHMLLSASTLKNLEIYCNDTDGSLKGSLLSLLDQTRTKFGSRLMRSWIGKPLIDRSILQERIDAVEEVLHSESEKLQALQKLLKGMPDLAKGLIHVQYNKCSPKVFAKLIEQCNRLAIAFDGEEPGFKSPLLNSIFTALPALKDPIKQILSDISLSKASKGLKAQMWINPDKYPDVADWQELLDVTEAELIDELRRVRSILKRPSLQWTTVGVDEYLIELDKDWALPIGVTDKWEVITSTKTKVRYRTDITKTKLAERARLKEQLDASADKAYKCFLQEVSEKYYTSLRQGVNYMAVADCLFSLAEVARRDKYVKPEFSDDGVLEIVDGRHPMTEVLRVDPFIPNTIRMDSLMRCLSITGPNMGGKSSVVRMIALIVIMAQIGSYVPADFVRLSFTDGVYTRMGASDNLARGRSTFMTEMTETSDILKEATSKSLVILDELGRGTSTYDGMAIAHAVLQHLLETTQCRTLFITHYPSVVSRLGREHPSELQNVHMEYVETTNLDGTRNVTFLYKIAPGISPNSFGVECARLAGLDSQILEVAARKSKDMEDQVASKKQKRLMIRLGKLISQAVAEESIAVTQQLANSARVSVTSGSSAQGFSSS